MPKLIVFSGLPGTGKTTLARALAKQTRALYLQVDDIEIALKKSSLNIHPAEDAGYLAAQAIAESNLNLGRSVIVDAVNPVALTRRWWSHSAERCNAGLFRIALSCSDYPQHRARVEQRGASTAWTDVITRRFELDTDATLHLDTGKLLPDACLLHALKMLKNQEKKLENGI